MTRQEEARQALRSRILANRFVAAALLLAILLSGFLWLFSQEPRQHTLRMTAGEALSHRTRLAEILRQEAAKFDLTIELISTTGSEESMSKIAAGEIDAALALGDYDIPDEHIRQLAILNEEYLHLFVKPELVDVGLAGLRGKTLSLSSVGTNTHKMAERLLRFVGLDPGVGYQSKDYSHPELLALGSDQLPDAIFAISSLPWVELGEYLVKERGYRLMELPIGEAVAQRNPAAHDAIIPAYSYSAHPPVPPRPLHTVGQKLIVVAGAQTSPAAIERLMKVIFESEFSRRARIPTIDPSAVTSEHEFPLHEGARKYLNRNEPLIKADSIDKLENLRSFLVSAALAAFLFWRWQKRRKLIGFETYFDQVSEVELKALEMDRAGRYDPVELRRLGQQLSEIKYAVLERHSEGTLTGEDEMGSFLAHVSDVRSYVESLFLHPPRHPTTDAPTS